MSTVTPVNIDAADAYDETSVNTAFTGLTDGFNDLEDDDFADDAFGHETSRELVVALLDAKSVLFNAGVTPTTISTAYPGVGVVAGWEPVVIDSTDVKLTATVGFEVGPASPEKIIGVYVGATFKATSGRFAIGVKHSGNAAPEAIVATDFNVRGIITVYAVEVMITEDDVPPGETLEEIWLLGTGTGDVSHGQLWGLPLHGG